MELTRDDHQLIEAAEAFITRFFDSEKHVIGSALRADSGSVYCGLHMDTRIEKMSTCAEIGALQAAIVAEEEGLDTIVAVKHPYPDDPEQKFKVVSPCGMCREVIIDYGVKFVIFTDDDGAVKKLPARNFLFSKYK